MIRRAVAAILILWIVGFFAFAFTLPTQMSGGITDAIVVPTGADGRIARGLELMQTGMAKKMLVTGVDPEVTPNEFAVEYNVGSDLMLCCITLGNVAADTRGNAEETGGWVDDNDIATLRLVTTDWHMRRAALELGRILPAHVKVARDAVPSQPSLRILFLEYNKLLASALSVVVGR